MEFTEVSLNAQSNADIIFCETLFGVLKELVI